MIDPIILILAILDDLILLPISDALGVPRAFTFTLLALLLLLAIPQTRKMIFANKKALFVIGVLVIIVFAVSSTSASVIQSQRHLNMQFTDADGDVLTGTNNYNFTYTSGTACDGTNVYYTNYTTLTTDDNGIISYYLEGMNVSNPNQQFRLCIWRDDVLESNFKVAPVDYSQFAINTTWEGVIDKPTHLSNFTDDLDGTYLKLDTSNDPLTGNLNGGFVNFSAGGLVTFYDIRTIFGNLISSVGNVSAILGKFTDVNATNNAYIGQNITFGNAGAGKISWFSDSFELYFNGVADLILTSVANGIFQIKTSGVNITSGVDGTYIEPKVVSSGSGTNVYIGAGDTTDINADGSRLYLEGGEGKTNRPVVIGFSTTATTPNGINSLIVGKDLEVQGDYYGQDRHSFVFFNPNSTIDEVIDFNGTYSAGGSADYNYFYCNGSSEGGITMTRDGSIVGMSAGYDVEAEPDDGSALRLHALKNGGLVWFTACDLTAVGTNKNCTGTQAIDTDTFVAGDKICMQMNLAGLGTYQATLSKFVGTIEVVYD